MPKRTDIQKILIIGATSAIAEATARLWAGEGHRLYLVARNGERLQAMAADLKIRGAESTGVGVLDLNDFARHQQVLDDAVEALDGIDVVLIAHGTLGDQKAILFYLGFFPAFMDLKALTMLDALIVILIAAVAVGSVKLGYAWAASRAGALVGVRVGRPLNIVAACVMIVVGAVLMVRS